jgi:hypothetical protein
MKPKNVLWTISVVMLSLVLFSCGGGDNGGTGQQIQPPPPGLQTNIAASLFVTDRSADEFSQVFVTLRRVELTSGDQNYLLFDNPAGTPLNLLELAGEKRLLSVNELPAGTYEVAITVDSDVTLVENDGTVQNGRFSDDGDFTFLGNGQATIDDNVTEIVLDFDTSGFDVDLNAGAVTPSVIVSPAASANLPFNGKLEGFVTEIRDVNTFVFTPEHSALTITAMLRPNATVFDELSGETAASTILLAPGQKVEILGDYNAINQEVEASRVKIEADRDGSGVENFVKAEGNVISIGDNSFTLSLLEVKGFIPGAGSVEVRVNEATFIHEDRADAPVGFASIQPNQRLEVKGTLSDGSILASIIEIKSTTVVPPPPSTGMCASTPAAQWADFFGTSFPLFSELEGNLTEVGGETITVNGVEVVLVQETRLHVDDNGNICVNDLPDFIGQRVEVKVAFAGNIAVAHKVEIKTAGGIVPPPPVPSPVSGTIIEITLDHEGEHTLINVADTGWVKIEEEAVITDAAGNFIPPFTLFTNRGDFEGKQFTLIRKEEKRKSERTIDGRTVTIAFEVKQGQIN